MPEEKPRCEADAAGMARKLTLLDGSRVGIMKLDIILQQVAGLKLVDNRAIRTELLDRVKACNYVAPSAEHEYSASLLREYQDKFGEPGEGKTRGQTEVHQHSGG